MKDRALIPKRPYLLRAMHEWISENGLTPHVIVDATQEGVAVPAAYVKDGKIVLNVSLSAVQHLQLANDRVEFHARFSGVSHHIRVPISAVLGIYARETGEGMAFAEEEFPTPPDTPDAPSGSADQVKRPQLKVVK